MFTARIWLKEDHFSKDSLIPAFLLKIYATFDPQDLEAA